MIRIPDKSSWTNAFKLEDFLRWICQRLCEYTWITHMQKIISGRLIREAAARTGFLRNMITTTAQIVKKSGISVVTQLPSTSFKELMSPIMRARILPVGRLSKKEKSRVWM